MRLHRSVTVEKPLDTVFGYLSDFTTTTQCDPGTVKTVRTSGDGGLGTEYLNTSAFAGATMGRNTEVTYTADFTFKGVARVRCTRVETCLHPTRQRGPDRHGSGLGPTERCHP